MTLGLFSLYAAFKMAIKDDYIRKNPFDFNIDEVIDNDTEPTIPLTLEQEESLYSFIKNALGLLFLFKNKKPL